MISISKKVIAYSSVERMGELIAMIYSNDISENAVVIGVTCKEDLAEALSGGATLVHDCEMLDDLLGLIDLPHLRGKVDVVPFDEWDLGDSYERLTRLHAAKHGWMPKEVLAPL